MQQMEELNVVKRNGNIETVSFDKILNRIKSKGQGGVEGTLDETNKSTYEDDKRINNLLMDIEKEF